jgi:hypothetical protein
LQKRRLNDVRRQIPPALQNAQSCAVGGGQVAFHQPVKGLRAALGGIGDEIGIRHGMGFFTVTHRQTRRADVFRRKTIKKFKKFGKRIEFFTSNFLPANPSTGAAVVWSPGGKWRNAGKKFEVKSSFLSPPNSWVDC